MNFSEALEHLKGGKHLVRAGWNKTGQFIFLVPGSLITVSDGRPLATTFPVGREVRYRPHIDLHTMQGEVVPWVPAHSDMLANDWEFFDAAED